MAFFEKIANEIDEERQEMETKSVEKKYLFVWASTDDKGSDATFVRIERLVCETCHLEQMQLDLQETTKHCQKEAETEQKDSKTDEKSTNLKEKHTRGNRLTGGLGTKCFTKYEKFFKDNIVLDPRSSINAEEILNAWVAWNSIPENWNICPSNTSPKNCSRTLVAVINRIHPKAIYRTHMTSQHSIKSYKVRYFGMRLKTKEEMTQ